MGIPNNTIKHEDCRLAHPVTLTYSGLSSTASSLSSQAHVQSRVASSSDEDGDPHAEEEDEKEEADVEDLLWAAQMDLIGHRHLQAVSKLQLAVRKTSSAACATLGNLLARGLRGEHPEHTRSPRSSPSEVKIASFSSPAPPHSSVQARPDLPPTSQNEDALGAAQLFSIGLDIEMNKPMRRIKANYRRQSHQSNAFIDPREDESSENESAEGRYFSLERCLDLVVGLTDGYRFGVVRPSEDCKESDPEALRGLWTRGASLAQRALAHPAIIVPPPLKQALSTPHAGISPSSRSRSVTRSYQHPTNALNPSLAAHPYLSLKTKLRLTITVHLMYLLALHTWTTDKERAKRYWEDIIRIGSTPVGPIGIKEGDEVVERARRRLAGIHRTEGPDEDWHMVKSKKRGRGKPQLASNGYARSSILPTRIDVMRQQGSGDAVLDMRRELEESIRKKEEAQSRAIAEDLEDLQNLASADARTTSLATTMKGISSRRDPGAASVSITNGPPTATPLSAASMQTEGRLPRPSKFHFAPEVSNDYPSPPDTPGTSPLLDSRPKSALPFPVVSVSSLVNTLDAEEGDSHCSEVVSASSTSSTAPGVIRSFGESAQNHGPDTSNRACNSSRHIHHAHQLPEAPCSPRRRVVSMGTSSLASDASGGAWFTSERLHARAGSSTSLCTLPPDFGSSTNKGKGRAVDEPEAANAFGIEIHLVQPHRRSVSMSQLEPTHSFENQLHPNRRGGGATRWEWESFKSRPRRFWDSLLSGSSDDMSGAVTASNLLKQVLTKSDESAQLDNHWGSLAEEDEETEHEDAYQRELGGAPQSGHSVADDAKSAASRTLIVGGFGLQAILPTSTLDSPPSDPAFDRPVVSISEKRSKAIEHSLSRVRASGGAATRSFVDVTSATDDYPSSCSRPRVHSRHSSTNGKLHLPDKTSSAWPSALDAPKLGRLEHRSASSPNFGKDSDMDPVLLELEIRSRVGVRTVCASCGKKGLNFPASRNGQTFCSRDCRIKGNGGSMRPASSLGSDAPRPAGAQ